MPRLRTLVALFLLAVFAPTGAAQLGKNVTIPAGSEADRQLVAINAASDPAQKLQLIDQFSQAYADGDLQIVADEQYVSYYINAKQYDKAFEYGDKLFALDPDNYSNAVNMVRAANEKGDTAKLFAYAEKAAGIIERFKAAPAPEGTAPDNWTRIKTEKLGSLKDNQDYIEQSLFRAAYGIKDPKAKADALQRIAKMYPDTPQAEQALTLAASAYQQAQDRAKMQAVANSVLAKNPDNIGILLLLADDYSERGDQLDKAEQCAKKATMLLDAAKKPDNLTEDQWKQQISIQKGLALSALGQVNIQKKQNALAVDSLTKAAPLLKANPFIYARNQYRLGFAYLNLKRNPEAKQAFTDAASLDTPYKGPAQQKLTELSGAKPAPKKAS
jgi:tetratricopeptide (TPR) repeat protein